MPLNQNVRVRVQYHHLHHHHHHLHHHQVDIHLEACHVNPTQAEETNSHCLKVEEEREVLEAATC